MRKMGILLAGVVLLAALATGCDSVKDMVNSMASEVSTVADAASSAIESATEDPEVAEIEKHNAYVELFNTLIDDIDKVVEDYVDEFGAEEEVYIEDNFTGFSIYSNSILQDMDKALEYADKEPAEAQADAALKAMEPVLREYATVLDSAKKYYGDKNYVDDDYAKAQEYHTVIVGQYDAVWEKVEAFLTAVDVMLEGQDEAQLAKYKENGSMIHYYSLLAVVTGQEMVAYLYDHEITAANILDIDLEEFRPLYDAFAAAYTEYDALVGDNSDAGRDEGIMTLSTFTSTLSDVKSNAAELVNRVQNGKAFSGTDLTIAHMKDGTPESLISEVSSLLSNYNNWIV